MMRVTGKENKKVGRGEQQSEKEQRPSGKGR
jgi:hypothetical protein